MVTDLGRDKALFDRCVNVPEEICGVDLQVQGNRLLFIGIRWPFNHLLNFCGMSDNGNLNEWSGIEETFDLKFGLD